MQESILESMLYNMGRQINAPLMIVGAIIVGVALAVSLWLKTSYRGYAHLEAWNAAEKPLLRGMLVLAGAYLLSYTWLSLHRYDKMLCGAWDLAIFDSLFANALSGRIFQDYRGPFDHFQPALALYLPFYALWQDARTLLVMQTVALTLAVWPLYLLVREITKSRSMAAVMGMAYLLYPSLGAGNLYDFHGLSLTPLFFFSMLLFMVRRRWTWYWVSFAALILVKESEAILAFGAGLYLMSHYRGPQARQNLLIGGITVGVATLWFFLSTKVLLPWMSGGHFIHFGRYEGLPDVLKWAVGTGHGAVSTAAYSARVTAVLTYLTLPVGFLLFRRWRPFVLVFGPYFAVNIFSRSLHQNVFHGHYTLTVAAAVLGSTALALEGLRGLRKNEPATVLVLYLLIVASLSNLMLSWPASHRHLFAAVRLHMASSFNILSLPLPVTKERIAFYRIGPPERFIGAARHFFPAGSTIATQNSLGYYFATGYKLKDFRAADVEADFYLFDIARGDNAYSPPEIYVGLLNRLRSDPDVVCFLMAPSPEEAEFVFFAAGDKWVEFYTNALAALKRDPRNLGYQDTVRAIERTLRIGRFAPPQPQDAPTNAAARQGTAPTGDTGARSDAATEPENAPPDAESGLGHAL